MPVVRPFVGLLYDESLGGPAGEVTSPPYDTISPLDQERYHQASPHNVIRLDLGKDEPRDDRSDNKYTRAASHLGNWRDRGILRATPRPSLFPYEMRFQYGGTERRIRGVIAEVELEAWGGSILRHERTMSGPVEDRLRLLREVRANLSPIYTVYSGPRHDVAAFLDEVMRTDAERELVDEAGTAHRLWVSQEGDDLLGEALREQQLLIADGHHRYTVALSYRDEMRALHGPGPWDSMMMLVVDGTLEDPPVLPIHRLVLSSAPAFENAGRRVRDLAEVLASLEDEDLRYGSVRMDGREAIHEVATLSGTPPTVCALHRQILDVADGLELRFVPDAAVAEQSVRSGEAAAAYFLPATRVERVRQVIERGDVLPQKSTYFWPKPRTGLVIRPLEP